jgi:molybdopterin molybdotransferase
VDRVRTDLSAAEALAAVLAETAVLAAEMTDVRAALGRVLAEPIASGRRLPPADNSAMDGYAVRRVDLASASRAQPVELRVAFEIVAGGAPPAPLGSGEAARILTGAPLPAGADAVVRQEDALRRGDRVRIALRPEPRQNVRDAGEDVEIGEVVLEPGRVIGPAEAGMLASLGRGVVAVRQRPRVAILSGGDELVEPDGDVAGGRIVSSNSYTLSAQCREVGAEPVYLGIARDTPEDLLERFRGGLRADVIVSSAGVSVGDRDYVRDVLAKLGCELRFWGVRIKPGYPLAFGRLAGGALVFGLPGNPVSAMVTFEEFVRPALRKMTGHATLFRPLVRARLAERLAKQPGRMHFVRVVLERQGGEILARSAGNQSSGALASMVRGQGLLVFPAEASELGEGESATVQVIDESFLASAEPGF